MTQSRLLSGSENKERESNTRAQVDECKSETGSHFQSLNYLSSTYVVIDRIRNRRSLIGAWICALQRSTANRRGRDPPSMGKRQERGNSSQEKGCRKKPRRVGLAVKADRLGSVLVISRTYRGLCNVSNRKWIAIEFGRVLSQKVHIVAHNSPGAYVRTMASQIPR